MGIMKEILDTIKDISTVGKDSLSGSFKQRRNGSLSRMSQEGTLQFPVLVTKSLDIDTLQMVSKALERQYGSFVQTALTMNPVLNLSTDKDAFGYLRKFHQNSGAKAGLNDYFNTGASILSENYEAYSSEEKELFMFAYVHEGATSKVTLANREQLVNVMEGIREDVLNDKFVPRSTYHFKDTNLAAYHNKIVTEAQDKPERKTQDKSKVKSDTRTADEKDNLVMQMPNQILKDNDIRKANELVPTTMHIRTLLTNNGVSAGTMDFMIGVKTTMHPIASDEMTTNLVNAARNKGKIFNTVRWTSGEIGFFKDFLFNISQIKDDVSSRSAGSSPWWIALKRRRALAKVKGSLRLPSQILPNASIVISMEEAAYIKSEYGFDLTDVNFVNKIMGEYFLLSFVIVDNSTQIVHFLFDGQDDYQSVSFSGLERDNKSGGGVDFKDVLKLVQRS
jgi:hypothetical protein